MENVRALILVSPKRIACAAQRWLGLTVIERMVRNLRQHRFTEIVIAGGPRFPALEALADMARLDVGDPSDQAGEVAMLRRIAAQGNSALLVLAADTVYHPDLPASLCRAAARSGRSQIFLDRPEHSALYLLAADLPHVSDLPAETTLAGLAQRCAGQPERFARYEGSAELFATPVSDAVERKRATALLMRTNWRPHDGIVARLINKHLSVRLSLRLADTPITPNMITIGATLIALVGVALIAAGSYWSFIAGATLLQLQSILDGCDGELARMRYQGSRLGAWLDTAVDDFISILLVAALGHGAAIATGQCWFALFGDVVAIVFAIATGLFYVALWRAGATGHHQFHWWFEPPQQTEAPPWPDLSLISTWVGFILRRDFYVLFFWVLALFGQIAPAALILAIGSLAWCVTLAIQIAKRGLTAT